MASFFLGSCFFLRRPKSVAFDKHGLPIVFFCLGSRCVRQERISLKGSVRWSVRPSVCMSVTPVPKPRFYIVSSDFVSLYVTCYSAKFNPCKNAFRTHHCPVGLVYLGFFSIWIRGRCQGMAGLGLGSWIWDIKKCTLESR